MTEYDEFLKSKIHLVHQVGLDVPAAALHPSTAPHQADAIRWALRVGRALIAMSFGLGKTHVQIEIAKQVVERVGGRFLIVCPLGVRHQFIDEDGPRLGVRFQYVRTDEEVAAATTPYLITNYERVRDGDIDVSQFSGISLDEGSVLRSLGSKTQDTFTRLCRAVPYRFVATATPSPNEYREIIYYAQFLEHMDIGQALAQPLDANILTPDGWKEMGEIQAGDLVIAVDGSATTVLGVYPQGTEPIYKVSFSDGSSTECTEEHLWLTRTQYERNNERRYRLRNGAGNDGSRNDQFATVKSTADIAESLRTSQGGLNHDIPLVGAVEFASRSVAVDPYLMGVLLGDGHIRQTSVNLCTADEFIRAAAEEIVAPHGLVLRKIERGGERISYDYAISNGRGKGHGGGQGNMTNVVLNGLRFYNLLDCRAWDKRVPEDYLFNTADVRLATLQGLMDTDGTIDEANRTISFITTSPGLASDVQYLARSFGGVATISRRTPSLSAGMVAGRPVQGRHVQYKVNISLPEGVNPFRLPRKAGRVVPKTKYPPKRYITGVERIGEKEAQCIAVAHPSRLYVTDDFIVTHNTRWFKRDPNKAGNLTIHPHHEQAFWMWVASWALFVNRPSDLGYSDEGYDLPELRVHWHRLPVDHTRAWEQVDNRGQHRLLLDAAGGVREAVAEKRATLEQRVAKAAEIVAEHPDRHWLLWHHLEDERRAIDEAIPGAVSVYGSQALEERERRILDFAHGQVQILSSKPELSGSGCNFQYHCHSNVFIGVDYRFQDFIQAIHRTHRFQQRQPVDVHIIYAESEDEIVSTLRRKWQQHDKLVARMSDIIRQYGLSEAALAGAMQRGLGVMREEMAGQLYTAIHNDTVEEAPALADDSVGLLLTSIPFGNHYEYAALVNDFGHNDDDDRFFTQMDYLIPHLYRTLMPGRIAAIHVKDRIMYGWQGETGFMYVNPFSDKTVAAFQRHGFLYQGRITIATDVVRENNSTYRLGYTEMTRDGSKMGVGLPEYVLLFRKPPSDNTTARADVPVVKAKDDYSIGRWQLDAHAFWRSDGNRPLAPWEAAAHYDYAAHVAEMERLDGEGNLPKYFLIHAPESPSFYCWSDVNLMQGLNAEQARRRQENHVCPLPFDIVDRLIRRYSNEGELVYDPFAGLFTVPYCAVRMGRRGLGVELNHDYYTWGVRYMQLIEQRALAPTLFDLHEFLAEVEPAEVAL